MSDRLATGRPGGLWQRSQCRSQTNTSAAEPSPCTGKVSKSATGRQSSRHLPHRHPADARLCQQSVLQRGVRDHFPVLADGNSSSALRIAILPCRPAPRASNNARQPTARPTRFKPTPRHLPPQCQSPGTRLLRRHWPPVSSWLLRQHSSSSWVPEAACRQMPLPPWRAARS